MTTSLLRQSIKKKKGNVHAMTERVPVQHSKCMTRSWRKHPQVKGKYLHRQLTAQLSFFNQ